MNCPKCDSKSQVTDSRYHDEFGHQWRRRKCLSCGNRFTTYEIPVSGKLSRTSGVNNNPAAVAERKLEQVREALKANGTPVDV